MVGSSIFLCASSILAHLYKRSVLTIEKLLIAIFVGEILPMISVHAVTDHVSSHPFVAVPTTLGHNAGDLYHRLGKKKFSGDPLKDNAASSVGHY